MRELGIRTFKKAPSSVSRALLSRSASSRIIAKFFPPSSSRTGFNEAAAREAINRPTGVEPVKLHFRTAGWLIIVSYAADASWGRCMMKFRTPGGKPASWKSWAIK